MTNKHEVLEKICNQMGVTVEQAKNSRRFRNATEARQMYSYWLKVFAGLTLNEIGKEVRHIPQDHTTVMHSIRHIQNLIHTEDRIKEIWLSLPLPVVTSFTSLKYKKPC